MQLNGLLRGFPLPGDGIKCQDWVVEFNLKPLTKQKSNDTDYTSWCRSGKTRHPGPAVDASAKLVTNRVLARDKFVIWCAQLPTGCLVDVEAGSIADLNECGFKDFEATVWYGLMGPSKMRAAMVARMNENINKVLAMSDVQEKMEQYGVEDGGGSTEKFADFIKAEQVKWAQVATNAKVRADA